MLIVTVLIMAGAGLALLYYWISTEVITELTVLNAEGERGTALIVYHPGLSQFQAKVSHAFARGLASNGWRVEITTASAKAPISLSGYDLLVLGAPTYSWTPARPIRSYLSRVRNLKEKPTVTIISAMGAGARSSAVMEKLVRKAHGKLIKSLLLYTLRPNEDLYGTNDAEEIATQAAKEIPLPKK